MKREALGALAAAVLAVSVVGASSWGRAGAPEQSKRRRFRAQPRRT
jgi:hypothetical protein